MELLAPAGNLKIFYAVVNAGADAVYVGGPSFGARAYAKNFTTEELVQAISYAHLHHVKVYMTVNTLLKENELQDCVEMMIPFYEAGLDGVIIQDMALISLFSKAFPDLELHGSTQLSISNVTGAKLMKQAGMCRVVPARELSLKEIKAIRDEAQIEVETFVHGALCYSYSGQCLMSSCIGGRSGNRGRCAQPCRLPYSVYDSGKMIQNSAEIISLKDLNTIELLPDLIDAGIDSFKIEGRMKQASYAYTVVSMYRKYMDLYVKNGRESYGVSKKDKEILLNSGNRDGFTDGYYFRHNGPEMITKSSAHNSNSGVMDEDSICLPKESQIRMEGSFEINKKATLTIQSVTNPDISITFEDDIVQVANNRSMDEELIKKQLLKTGGSFFTCNEIHINVGEQVFIPNSILNQFRRNAIDAFEKKMLTKRKAVLPVEELFSDQQVPRILGSDIQMNDGIHTSVLLNDLTKLDVVLEKDYVSRVYLEVDDLFFSNSEKESIIKRIKESGKECYLACHFVYRENYHCDLHSIFEEEKMPFDGILVRSYDEILPALEIAKKTGIKVVADEQLYSFSSVSKRQLESFGVSMDTVPYELNGREIENRDNRNSELLVYGRLPVMITANCIHKTTKGCDRKSKLLYLKDQKGYQFPVRNYCNSCTNVIYNSMPLCIFQKPLSQKLNVSNYRLAFLTESKEQMEDVFALYEKNVLGFDGVASPLKDFTWGHYKHGVE